MASEVQSFLDYIPTVRDSFASNVSHPQTRLKDITNM
ncbi:hypothetical protein BN1086_04835 [Citrobacter koseri]|uniref:Uncharacterized protein n=1 Tax=Citrobacter koseri TaxID=545 RepID=A0A078LQG7_CITKO|nr:hypothetical protein BN1086_04835 [Citrobacter koseri]